MVRFTTRLALCLAMTAAAPAMARQPRGDELSPCSSASTQPECRLVVENPGFDDEGALVSWTVNPFHTNAVQRFDEANPKLAFQPDGSIFQIVPLPEVPDTGKAGAYYLPALFARSSKGDVRLRLRVQLIDGPSTRTVFSRDYPVGEAWTRPSGGFDISGASPSAALAIHITRLDQNSAARLLIDDVEIVRQLSSE